MRSFITFFFFFVLSLQNPVSSSLLQYLSVWMSSIPSIQWPQVAGGYQYALPPPRGAVIQHPQRPQVQTFLLFSDPDVSQPLGSGTIYLSFV